MLTALGKSHALFTAFYPEMIEASTTRVTPDVPEGKAFAQLMEASRRKQCSQQSSRRYVETNRKERAVNHRSLRLDTCLEQKGRAHLVNPFTGAKHARKNARVSS